MINDIVQFLHEKLLEVVLDEILSDVKQLQVLLNGLKCYASNLESKILKDVEKRVEGKRVKKLGDRCADTHTRLKDSISLFKKVVDDVVIIYYFFHQWLFTIFIISGRYSLRRLKVKWTPWKRNCTSLWLNKFEQGC